MSRLEIISQTLSISLSGPHLAACHLYPSDTYSDTCQNALTQLTPLSFSHRSSNNVLLDQLKVRIQVEPLVEPLQLGRGRLLVRLGREPEPQRGLALGDVALADVRARRLVVVDFVGVDGAPDQVEPVLVAPFDDRGGVAAVLVGFADDGD